MALRFKNVSAGPVVSLADARDHLLIDPGDTSHDAAITRELRAITAWLAGSTGWLGRSILTQTLELTIARSAFDGSGEIVLPRPPVIKVEAVSLIDLAGNAHDVASNAYTVDDGCDGLSRVVFRSRPSLPAGSDELASLRVEYQAGYGPSADDVDEGLKQAILMMLARIHEFRGDGVSGGLQVDPFVAQLFGPYRVWGPV